MADYDTRAKEYGFSTKEELTAALANTGGENVIILDVRSKGEIDTSGTFEKEGILWVHAAYTKDGCEKLTSDAEGILLNKEGRWSGS